jgi:hypothetical protein
MANNNGIKVKRNEKAVWRVIDGEVVVLIPEEGMLHALTGCGSRVWELIEGETAVSDISDIICQEYDVEPEKAEAEISEFMHNLEFLNLLEIVPEAS